MYVCTHVENRRQFWVLFLRMLFTLFFETGYLIGLALAGLARLANEPQESFGFCLPITGIKVYHHTWLFHVGSEDQSQIFQLAWQTLYCLSYFPSLVNSSNFWSSLYPASLSKNILGLVRFCEAALQGGYNHSDRPRSPNTVRSPDLFNIVYLAGNKDRNYAKNVRF